MRGMNVVVKMLLAVVVVVAAASGTDVIDVLMVTGQVTEQAHELIERVELDGDETALFDRQVDPATGEVIVPDEFARPSDKVVPDRVLAFEEPVVPTDTPEPDVSGG